MPAAVLIGIGAVALLSGPICGGVQWHHWNREHGHRFWMRKYQDETRDTSKEETLIG
jgi:hypothetical protein